MNKGVLMTLRVILLTLLGFSTFFLPGVWPLYKRRWWGAILLVCLIIIAGLLISSGLGWAILSIKTSAILLLLLYAVHFVLLAGELATSSFPKHISTKGQT